MKKLILGTSVLALMSVFPLQARAQIDIHIPIPSPPHIRIGVPAPPQVRIGIPMPPHIQFSSSPRLVVVPETYVYVAPDVEEEIFFVDGWWWRPWDGRWYRSRSYDTGWQHYRKTPSFYNQVPNGWRNDYRDGHWRGQQWNIEPIAHHEVQRNWRSWKTNRHWEKNQTWGVQDLRRHKEKRDHSQRGNKNHSKN